MSKHRTPSQYISAALDAAIRESWHQLHAARKYRDAHPHAWNDRRAEIYEGRLLAVLGVRRDAREASP
jgi:hypothetical protein